MLVLVDMRKTALESLPRNLAQVCEASEYESRVPGWPSHRWFTSSSAVFVMMGHTSSITLAIDMLNDRMGGDDMTTHAPKWLRDSASFPTSSTVDEGAKGTKRGGGGGGESQNAKCVRVARACV